MPNGLPVVLRVPRAAVAPRGGRAAALATSIDYQHAPAKLFGEESGLLWGLWSDARRIDIDPHDRRLGRERAMGNRSIHRMAHAFERCCAEEPRRHGWAQSCTDSGLGGWAKQVFEVCEDFGITPPGCLKNHTQPGRLPPCGRMCSSREAQGVPVEGYRAGSPSSRWPGHAPINAGSTEATGLRTCETIHMDIEA